MISVVIITKNEKKNIIECINSVLWADEIILVDAESTDNTPKIAQEISDKVKVFVRTWEGFSNAKNFGISKAKSKWILSVDADERVPDALRDNILEAVKTDKNNGYYIPRILYFCGSPIRFGGCYPDYQMRLFKKESGSFNNAVVHESFTLNGKADYLKQDLKHYSYRTISEYWARFNVYTSLDAQKKYQKGRFFSLLDVFVFPWELFRRMIIKKGIFDGIPGIFYHIFSAVSSLVKYAKLWELQNK